MLDPVLLSSAMRLVRTARIGLAVGVGAIALALAHSPSNAVASTGQVAMFQDDVRLLAAPGATLRQIRDLGAGVIRVSVHWGSVAPARRPAGFAGANPASYPGANWAVYDQIVSDARTDGLTVDFAVTGPAPSWALGAGLPGGTTAEFAGGWKPSGSQFKAFVQAVATRYSGKYDPVLGKLLPGAADDLPRVSFWEIWNEPNFGGDLAPQATNGSTVSTSPGMYRSLLDAGWSGLTSTGHGRDTVVIGNLDARGHSAPGTRQHPQGLPGNFDATKPMQFIRTLYCVSAAYQELRGAAAAAVGCPTNAAGSRRFRAAHPALFHASGFATHPYPVNLPPTRASSTDPDFTEFSELPRFAGALDRLQRIYGSGTHFAIYNNEYGYITNPPNRSLTSLKADSHFVSPATAAAYINWAEYLSYRNPRIASAMQYLLYDPNPLGQPEYGGFASGLILYSGVRQPGYDAYRLPLFVPVTSAARGRTLEVWGAVRPAPYAKADTGTTQRVLIQFQPGGRGAWQTLEAVSITGARGYFDVRLAFPASGSVRLSWTYPANDPLLGPGLVDPPEGATVYSRSVAVTVK